jgi:hypothetical protein
MKFKQLFIVLVLFLAGTNGFGQKIGFIQRAQHRISADLSPLKKAWELALIDQNRATELIHFEIESGLDQTLNKTFYVLTAVSRDGKTKVYAPLKNVGGNLSIAGKDMPLSSIVYIDRTEISNVVIDNNSWRCERSNQETCTPSVLIE